MHVTIRPKIEPSNDEPSTSTVGQWSPSASGDDTNRNTTQEISLLQGKKVKITKTLITH